MRHLPLLLASAVLLLAGSARAVAAGGLEPLAVALLAAGLILLGVWIRDEDGGQ